LLCEYTLFSLKYFYIFISYIYQKHIIMDKLPKIAQKLPYIKEEKAGRKAFCTCGLSSKNPYCDGSHKGTGFSPEIVIIEEDKKVAWCGCKHSSKGAFCDGSHRNL
jgi:CDGSH-type Zn-finger protein